ncbi:MAG: GNAT family N-acetyltransferase [Muribaculaceae bacterium]|nr:GNAT family N-acetyltransferase [Muribaculaceae bacterium]
MIIRTVSESEYYEAFPVSHNAFTSRAFVDVTPYPGGAVRFFTGYGDDFRPCLGLVAGYRDGEWHAPYSAPFTAPHYTDPPGLEDIYDFISELTDMLSAPLHLTLPPDYYDRRMLPAITGILGNFARVKTFDFDFHFPTSAYGSYLDNLEGIAADQLHHALDSGLTIQLTADIHRVCEVIRIHRETCSYPPAMPEDQLQATIDAVGGEMFVLSHEKTDVAAGIVLHVAEGIVKVLYLGETPGYADLRPLNLLVYHMFGHYAASGIDIVDMGTSSTAGIPNIRQCRFKESVGCRIALAPAFVF